MTALFVDGKAVEVINAGQEAVVVLDQLPIPHANQAVRLAIKGEPKGADLLRRGRHAKYGQAIGHIGKLSAGALKVGRCGTG